MVAMDGVAAVEDEVRDPAGRRSIVRTRPSPVRPERSSCGEQQEDGLADLGHQLVRTGPVMAWPARSAVIIGSMRLSATSATIGRHVALAQVGSMARTSAAKAAGSVRARALS